MSPSLNLCVPRRPRARARPRQPAPGEAAGASAAVRSLLEPSWTHGRGTDVDQPRRALWAAYNSSKPQDYLIGWVPLPGSGARGRDTHSQHTERSTFVARLKPRCGSLALLVLWWITTMSKRQCECRVASALCQLPVARETQTRPTPHTPQCVTVRQRAESETPPHNTTDGQPCGEQLTQKPLAGLFGTRTTRPTSHSHLTKRPAVARATAGARCWQEGAPWVRPPGTDRAPAAGYPRCP